MTIKCVVWDLDGTVWPGVAIEGPAGTLPPPFPRALTAMATLEDRGVVNSVASRTDPSLLATLVDDQRLGKRFVAPQLGWGDKHEAILRVAGELGIGPDTVAFVDDNPFERAEVAAFLPEVTVLAPEELYAQIETGTMFPPPATEEARLRVDRYRADRARGVAEREFGGERADFLRSCEMVLSVAAARSDDVARVAELAERTHRFNTTGQQWTAAEISDRVADPGWFVPVARLRDRFGDYGLISTAIAERFPQGEPVWRLRLFMVSCRAAGRDVPLALLGWIMRRARLDGARSLRVDIRADLANLELRVLLRKAGFTAMRDVPDGATMLTRDLSDDLPVVEHLRPVE